MGADSDPVDLRDYFEERAAYLEFDCQLPPPDAERQALVEAADAFGLTVAAAREAIASAGSYER
jgi:hypothetical protein